MDWIKLLFEGILKAPLSTILVISGVLFLFLSIVGKVGARIVVNPQRQRMAGWFGTFLLISGVALHFLGPLPSDKLPVYTPLTPSLTREFLVSKYWEFRHGEGDVISSRVNLQTNGTISGIGHPNESTWKLENGTVVFYHANGTPSTRFTEVRHEDGKLKLSGHLLLVSKHEPDVIHVLKEL